MYICATISMSMSTITLKINERSKAGKALKAMLDILLNQPGVEIIDSQKEETIYNTEFVAMVKKSAASKNRTKVDPKNVWAGL
jgi:hypothetical protein